MRKVVQQHQIEEKNLRFIVLAVANINSITKWYNQTTTATRTTTTKSIKKKRRQLRISIRIINKTRPKIAKKFKNEHQTRQHQHECVLCMHIRDTTIVCYCFIEQHMKKAIELE